MMDMDSSIRKLFDDGIIDTRTAFDKAIDKELFQDLADAR